MGQQNNTTPIEDIIHVRGNTLTVKVGEYLLRLKIEGQETKPSNNVIHVEGNSLTIKLGEYLLRLKIDGQETKPSGRLKLESGQTLYDLVLEAANTYVKDTGKRKFNAAVLYQVAREKHPELDIRKNSWYAHFMSSAPNHPSYRHHTSHRSFFRYLGRGKYSLEPGLTS